MNTYFQNEYSAFREDGLASLDVDPGALSLSAIAVHLRCICRAHKDRCSKSIQFSKLKGRVDDAAMILRIWAVAGMDVDEKNTHEGYLQDCLWCIPKKNELIADEVLHNWMSLGPYVDKNDD